MVAVTAGSIVVDASILAGVVGLVVTVMLVIVAVLARMALVRRMRRREVLGALWSPLMLRSLRGELLAVPKVTGRDRTHVLSLWLQLTETVAGDGQERLVRFARHAGLADLAMAAVTSRNPVSRTTAAAVLGRMREARATRALTALAHSDNLFERTQAARALVRIDPVSGLSLVVPLVARWDDCHPATASKILEDAPADVAAPALAGAAVAARDPKVQARLVRILATLHHPARLEAARRMLASTDDPEVVAGCLQIVADHRDPGDADAVRGFLRHPAPFVRVQAVTALGRLRRPGDEWRIVGLLSDPDWWVRYRAARALITTPNMARAMLERLGDVLPDRYARGALRQALTETQPAV